MTDKGLMPRSLMILPQIRERRGARDVVRETRGARDIVCKGRGVHDIVRQG